MKRSLAVVLAVACSSGDSAPEPKPTGSAVRKASGLSAELAKEPSADKTPDKPVDKPPEKAPDKPPEKTPDKPPEKAPEPVASKVSIDAGVTATPIDAAPAKIVERKDPVKLTPELAAIKFELLPNWLRDDVAPATFSLVLNIPKTGDRKTFTFHYGYDLPNAPVDREQYKKLLGDQRVLAVTLDRQRGGAWYLEGTDASGSRAFRFVVKWGDKRIVCYGSAYHDAEHDPLGDLRDEVVVQAKKICESMSL
jgi:hypothetical protein